jgi:hypothetical protein
MTTTLAATTLAAGTTAAEPRRDHPAPVTVVVDQLELATLLTAGLHPAALPCERCGLQQGHHRPSATCSGFVRPQLPGGFGYADQLAVGQVFGFLPTTSPAGRRRLVASTCCAVGSLTVLTALAPDGETTTHWVDGSLVVATQPR